MSISQNSRSSGKYTDVSYSKKEEVQQTGTCKLYRFLLVKKSVYLSSIQMSFS